MNTYDDPVKAKSREKLETFIREHIGFRLKRPQDVRVLCLPGAEVEGQEALEVREVYDKLGIPRANITGIEYDAKKVELLNAAKLGIRVEHADADEYLRTTNRQFDIISLDYTGQQTERQMETLAHIGGRGILRDHGILATNYSTKRLSERMQKMFALRNLGKIIKSAASLEQMRLHGFKNEMPEAYDPENFEQQARDIIAGDIDLTKARDVITGGIEWTLWHGKYALAHYTGDLPEIYGGTDVVPAITQIGRQEIAQLYINRRPLYDLRWSIPPSKVAPIEQFSVGLVSIVDTIRANLATKLVQETGAQRPESLLLAQQLLMRANEPFMITQHDRYKYTSNKNELMYLDLVAVKRARAYCSTFDTVVKFNPLEKIFVFNPQNFTIPKLEKALSLQDEEARTFGELYNRTPTERVDLGSSWKRRTRAKPADVVSYLQSGIPLDEVAQAYELPKRLTRDEGLALRAAGVTPDEFKEYFRQPPMRVAGWAAHETRRLAAQKTT